MEDFIEMNESVLGEYVDLSVGCPSHDTLERVVSMVNPDFIKELKLSFETSSETTDLSKLIALTEKRFGEPKKTPISHSYCHCL